MRAFTRSRSGGHRRRRRRGHRAGAARRRRLHRRLPQTITVTSRQAIPLGHKIALADLEPGDTVIKHGEDIGRVVADIRTCDHAHVHNLKTITCTPTISRPRGW